MCVRACVRACLSVRVCLCVFACVYVVCVCVCVCVRERERERCGRVHDEQECLYLYVCACAHLCISFQCPPPLCLSDYLCKDTNVSTDVFDLYPFVCVCLVGMTTQSLHSGSGCRVIQCASLPVSYDPSSMCVCPFTCYARVFLSISVQSVSVFVALQRHPDDTGRCLSSVVQCAYLCFCLTIMCISVYLSSTCLCACVSIFLSVSYTPQYIRLHGMLETPSWHREGGSAVLYIMH